MTTIRNFLRWLGGHGAFVLTAVLIVPAYIPAYHLWRLLLAPVSLPVMNRLAGPWQSVTVLALVTYCLVCLLALAMLSPQTSDEPANGHADPAIS